MHFLYPERLWFLLLLTIPIIIHLFHFRRQKTLFFSSLRFIKF
ncbi:MAG: BatA domain-containing protein, partial [Bacteroidetes bacterium]|nr:BatA domain-containing protein [Bacteroidota bacterium]